MKKWRYILAIVLPGIMSFGFLEAYAKMTTPAQALDDCGFVQNIYNHRLSWKGELPIKMSIHESVPREMIPSIQAAMDTWNKNLGKKVFVIAETSVDGTKNLAKIKDGKNVIYWFGKGEWKGEGDDQARTVISWLGSKIQEADVLINADHTSFYSKKPTKKGQIDFESVVLHELGHVLGLKHNDSRPGIMATYLKANTERRHVLTADLSSIRCEYSL